MPDTDSPTPQPKPTEISCTVVDVSEGEYHELADLYLDKVLSRFEELQDQRDDVDIEYSVS
jgi:frataxin